MSIFLGLIHHPVLNRLGEVATTAVTNVDVHDLSRAGRTFGVGKFFVVTPIELQRRLVERVVHHWTEGPGSLKSDSRQEAFGLVDVVKDIETAAARIEASTGVRPLIAVTGARLTQQVTTWEQARGLAESETPVLVLFGTGHGLAPSVIEQADIRLPAIEGPDWNGGYNHLSVRNAAVIVMDRLLGKSR